MSMQQQRERKAALANECRNMMDKIGDRKWTEDETKQYDDRMDQIETINDSLEREQKLIDAHAEKEFSDIEKDAAKEKDKNPNAVSNVFKLWMRNGANNLSVEQAKIMNTLSVGTGSQGGYAVPANVSSQLIEAQKAFSAMRGVAEIITTSDGVPLSFPSSDGTAEVGELLAENASANPSDPTFGTIPLNVFLFSSKIVAVPFTLLQDASFDVEKFVQKRLGQRLGRICNQKFTTGAGTTEPVGIVTAATLGKTALTGNTLTFTYDDLVDTMEAVDVAYTENGAGKWMFSQAVRKVVRKMKDSQNRPIWTPGYDFGITAGVPDLLLGAEVKINNDMAVPAANAKSAVYGLLDQYAIRDSMQVSLFRFADSVYISKGQIGFLAWQRSGGNLRDTAAVKYLQHSAT